MNNYIKFENVKKVYRTGEVEIEALKNVSFSVDEGEFCVIVGASGAGKTTILNILGGMDTLTEGKVFLEGQDISQYDKRKLTEYRRYDVGFVFQFYNLVQNLTALKNVELAAQICKNPKILLCDEPTGALDYQTGKMILKILQDTCRKKGKTVIVISIKRLGGSLERDIGQSLFM